MAPSTVGFDLLLLISCSVALLLAIGYLFYSNRILAFLIGYALRLAWWNSENSRAWVSFESFHISLLAGKIMIKELRYHTSNHSIVAIKCLITWRYWSWRTREVKECSNEDDGKSSSLPCRIQISFEGFEWLLYNRTSSYDAILKRFQQRANSRDLAEEKTSPISGQSASHTRPSFEGGYFHRKSTPANTNSPYAYPPPQSRFSSQISRLAQTRHDFLAWITSFKPDFHELLPIGITALNGAIVCGNASTPTLAVARFSHAEGSYDIEAARSPYDLYKTIINFKFRNAKIDLERNPWYRGSLLQQGRLVSRRLVPNPDGSKLFYPEFVQLWSEQSRRQTLNKIEDIHAWMQAENETTNDYAIVETIFEAPELEISYYWDEPGVVPSTTTAGTGSYGSWNKDMAPQYGLDFIVHRGTVRYGPWADRQRFELQRLFFPPAYETAVPTDPLKPGEKRIYTEFKVFVELRDRVTFHVPCKEPSKDWQFRDTKSTGATRAKREGGWIELRAGDNSTVTYVASWVATATGYHVLAEMHLNEITVLSSVNEIQLLTAQSLTALCELPVPLVWNEARRWAFDLSFQKTKLNIIRDHINLFTDLGKDWTSGPPADFDRWIPMHYVANVTLQNFELTLFLNDHNIITHPHLNDANTLLTLHGETLRTHVDIPSTVFRPEHTVIPFWIEVPGVNFRLTLPKWNTHAIFTASRTTDFAFVTLLRLDASYLYHSDTRPEFIDQLRMEALCSDVVFVTFGWIIRHLMTVRENYFGNFTHFSTLREYILKRDQNKPVGDPVELKWREGKSNIFEVSLGVRFEDSVVVTPAGFPGYEFSLDYPTEVQQAPIEEPKGLGTCVVVNLPELQISLRAHDYSMEMSLNSSPVVTSVVENVVHSLNPSAYRLLGRKKLHIDGINIVANRLFGPQPRTSTYLCIWEIGIGTISGIVSTMELRGLLAAIVAFRLNFSDDVNAPAKEFAIPPDPDVTFLKVSATSVDVAWVAEHISIYFSLPKGITLDYNDLPGRNYKKVTEVRIKHGKIRALMHSAHLRDSWLEAGSVCFDVGMDGYTSPLNWRQVAKAQMEFISTQDAPTRRAWFLYKDSPMYNESRSYMPRVNQPFLPRTRSPRQNSEFHPHRHSTDPGSHKTGMQRAAEISDALDSEEDERVSEADRDARLANSRPETPLLYNRDYDSRSISSSDESDDADVTTEASDSDSDGPENDRANEMDGLFPVPSHYKEIVRRFECSLRDKPAFRDRPLFNLIRDSPVDEALPNISKKSSLAERDIGEATTRSIVDVHSTTRLIRSNSIDVLLTPLCVHVVRKISEEIFVRNSSMEMLVDSFTTAYLNDMPSENNSISERYDVEVATIRLRILQSLTPGNTFSSLSPPGSASEPTLDFSENSRILSNIDLSLHDPTLTFSQTVVKNNSHFLRRSVTCRGSFSRSTASLDTSVIHAFPRMNKSRKATSHCSFVVEASTIAYNSGVYVNLGDVKVNLLEKISPVMVATTADSLAVVLQKSLEIYKNGLTQSNLRKQRLLWYVLQSSRDLDVGDPLAQSLPSYLVQSGRPLQLRLDPSWKMFMYLRHCLRHLNPLDRQNIQQRSEDPSSLPPVKLEELYIMLSKRLQEWGHELDLDEIRCLHFLRYIFNGADHSPKRRKRRLPSTTFHGGTFDFTIFQSPSAAGEGLHSAISFGPVSITYRRHQLRTTTAVQGPSSPIAPSMTILDSSRVSCHHVITATMQKMSLAIHPTFIVFLRHLLHPQNTYVRQESTKTEAPRQSIGSTSAAGLLADESFDIFFKIPNVSIQAAVEGMVLEIGINYANIAITLPWTRTQSQIHHKEQHDGTGNGLLKFSRLYTRVKQSQEKQNPFQSNERDILTSIIISSAAIHLSISGDTTPSIKGLFFLDSVQLSVPRSALLTYHLIEEWRTQYLPNIYSMAQDLLADFDKRSQHASPLRARKSSTRRVLSPDFQISVKRIGISLQVMHGTWFSWDVYNTMFFVRNAPKIRRKFGITFGVHLSSQLIHIGARSVDGVGTSKTLKLVLPSFSSSGNYDGHHLQSHAIIDYISITLKPRYMDDILTVQHNLGNHFYEILDLIGDTRKGRPTAKRAPAAPIRYDVAFLLRGFRVGIVGPTTILDLTSTQMSGTAKNEGGLAWNFAVSNLALALSHHSSMPRPKSEFDRKLKSSYTVLDLEAHSSPAPSSSEIVSYILRLQVGRMHTVMTPNSVGELGDLIDFIQAEKLLRQEQRALELEEIKNKTKRVMRTFEVERPAESLKRSTSLLENRTVLLSITDIGIAFPLSLKDGIEVDTIGSVPAFLMSIQRATFSVKRHESGQASMGRLSLQFVEQFDQSHPSQFDGDNHRSRNRLLYPGMKAEFQSRTSTIARQLQIGAHVDGFILDLDPSIVDNVFGLMDVYRKGRERIDRLTMSQESSKFVPEDVPASVMEATYLAVRTSNILLTIIFQTGKVRLRDVVSRDQTETWSPSLEPGYSPQQVLRSRQDDIDDADADVIYFPRITVCGEYRATPAASKLPSSQDQESSILIFRSQLHTTINQIAPSIFPFLTGITQRIERRLRRAEAQQTSLEDTFSEISATPSQERSEFLTRGVLKGIQLSFSLRIDSSKVELLCGHNLGVVAALNWESGGFVVTLSPKSRAAHFAGSVNGLEVDLRHLKYQGGTVQTARVDARNVAFSVSYNRTDNDAGHPYDSISVVVDTEFGASLRLDRLQDILIFKAVYIDRLPGTVPQAAGKSTATIETESQDPPSNTRTVILARARAVKLTADLGHNVASAVIDLKSLVFRTHIAPLVTDFALSIGQINLDLEDERPLTGYMRLPEFSFTTIRHNHVQPEIPHDMSRMLDVTLTSGTLDLVLQSEKRIILQYHANPFDIRIVDDWSAISWSLPPEERSIRLDFTVTGTDVLAIASLQTIPRIIMVLAKLKSDLEAQRAEARSALATSFITLLPKPENALSEVAEAMIRSARSKLTEGHAFSYIVVQDMTLGLSNLRFVLFKNPNDSEMALFQGQEVNAELRRIVQQLDENPSRSLKLAFSALNLSKYSALKYRSEGDLQATTWLEQLLKGASEAIIARVPAMHLEMNSDIEYDGRQETLLYDLAATADDTDLTFRSIYVSLNLSLYVWAGGMVKGLGLEVEKALVAAGFNKPATDTVAASSSKPHKDDAQSVKPADPTTVSQVAETHLSSTPVSKSVTRPSSTIPGLPEPETLPPRKYVARSETFIDYGTIQQLGEATPDAKAPWLGLKETVPPRVHEYATLPMEVLMKTLLEVYSKQLTSATKRRSNLERRGSIRREESDANDPI